MITWDEIRALTVGLLHVESPPLGRTRLTDWLLANHDDIGRYYASELARREPAARTTKVPAPKSVTVTYVGLA